MSRLPLIRNLYDEELYFRERKEQRMNAYYEGFLNETDASVLLGFDLAMEEVGNSIASGLSEEDFFRIGLDRAKVDLGKVMRFIQDEEYDPFEDGDTKELVALSAETKMLMIFYRVIVERIENARNDYGISMIESMGEEELERNRSGFQQGTYKNVLIRMSEV